MSILSLSESQAFPFLENLLEWPRENSLFSPEDQLEDRV